MVVSEIIKACKDFASEKGFNLDNWQPISKKHNIEWWQGENTCFFCEDNKAGFVTIKIVKDSVYYYYKQIYKTI